VSLRSFVDRTPGALAIATVIDIRPARSSIDSLVSRCSSIEICSSRIDDISDACEASETPS
jgi:hypothetical protein